MSNDPLFLQIKHRIEDMILSGSLGPDDQVPSSTRMVSFYQVNHLTILKGVNMLVDEGILYKKRGVGMFVCADARERIHASRREALVADYVKPLVHESRRLGLSDTELTTLISRVSTEVQNDDEHTQHTD